MKIIPTTASGATAEFWGAFEEQQAYDYAMENSHEKGPCCCKCSRWYVYGGLSKLLIRQYGFTGEQLAEV